ncbi:hypothetical protein BH23CHL2_BH23CHL2_06240 [soil metagenome]
MKMDRRSTQSSEDRRGIWRFYFYFTPPVSPVGSMGLET